VSCETLHVVSYHIADAIIQTAQERGCDVIVMSSGGRKGLASLLLGNETRKVLAHTTVPVLVVK
jgi:nucleotide-binding universal stress UspA family protein